MNATQTPLLNYINQDRQLSIPLYQRTYSWQIKQCQRFLADILSITESADSDRTHFFGSIVRVSDPQVTDLCPKQNIIDGQQRLTTVTLLLALMYARSIDSEVAGDENFADRIRDTYLINPYQKDAKRYRLKLTEPDNESLIALINDNHNVDLSPNIKANYAFFDKALEANQWPLQRLEQGLSKLTIVDIELESERDNPQLIFESLNSTGLDLTQTDLIRNYVLMGLAIEDHKNLYYYYWRPIEIELSDTDTRRFDRFMRVYLSLRTGRSITLKNIYEAFKGEFKDTGNPKVTEGVLKDILKYARYFSKIALGKETIPALRRAFTEIQEMKVDIAHPFLLRLYCDFAASRITETEFLRILNLVQSLVFRRAVCRLQNSVLGGVFLSMSQHSEDASGYVKGVEKEFYKLAGGNRFPTDEGFAESLLRADLYNTANRSYCLGKIENHDRKEVTKVSDYSVEHIMPQNPTPQWQAALGDAWQQVYDTYLHTLGNLTLTGYNPELSDKSFLEKRDHPDGGYAKSTLRLNTYTKLAQYAEWNADTIEARTKCLAELMVKIWPYPEVAAEIRAELQQAKIYLLKGHPKLVKSPGKELFNVLHTRVLKLDASVYQEIYKTVVVYKTSSSTFLSVIGQATRLALTLNVEFGEIDDPKSLCIDKTGKGTANVGDIVVHFSELEQIDDVMALVEQVFNIHNAVD